MSKVLLVLTLFSLIGCSNKSVYDNLRQQQYDNCRRESPTTRDECVERINNQTYEEYERERKEVLE